MPKADSNQEGSVLFAGLDEVGKGPVAGPFCIAVTAFPENYPPIEGVDDSKKLSEEKREELAPKILKAASFVGVGWASPQFIDEHGMNAAWQAAATEALRGAPFNDMHLIVDGRGLTVEGYQGSQECIVKADAKLWFVGAASIVAKVSRDRDMIEMAKYYPGYDWEQNKGYGTKIHRQKILELGMTPYHRRSFLKKLARSVEKDKAKEAAEHHRVSQRHWG